MNKAYWKMTFTSMSIVPLNIFCTILFFLNGFLNITLSFRHIENALSTFEKLAMAAVWFSVGFLYILRLFFNRESTRFLHTTKFSKKIYTKQISFIIELINTVIFVFLISRIILKFKNNCTQPALYVMMISQCITHLFISFTTPFMIQLVYYKEPFHSFLGATKFDSYFLYFLFLGVTFLPAILTRLFAIPLVKLFPQMTGQNLIIMLGISAVMIVISCILNRSLIEYGYKKR